MSGPAALAAYLFLAACLLARVEIEVEGPDGWAARLPTWRFEPPWLLRLTNGKAVTGYHVFLLSFVLVLFHFPAALGGWSRALEARILSSYCLFAVTWDLQWFLWNPAWGPRRFAREPAAWLPRRVAGLPVEYWLGAAAAPGVALLFWPPAAAPTLAVLGWMLAFNAAAACLSNMIR